MVIPYIFILCFLHDFFVPLAAAFELEIGRQVFTTDTTNVTWRRHFYDPEHWNLLIMQLPAGKSSLAIPDTLNTTATTGILPVVFPQPGTFQLMAQDPTARHIFATSQNFSVLTPESNPTTNTATATETSSSVFSQSDSESLNTPTTTLHGQLHTTSNDPAATSTSSDLSTPSNSSASSNSSPSSDSSTSSSKRSIIIGCTVAAVVLILAFLAILVFRHRKRKSHNPRLTAFYRERMVRSPTPLGEPVAAASELERGWGKGVLFPSFRGSQISVRSSLYADGMKPQAM